VYLLRLSVINLRRCEAVGRVILEIRRKAGCKICLVGEQLESREPRLVQISGYTTYLCQNGKYPYAIPSVEMLVRSKQDAEPMDGGREGCDWGFFPFGRDLIDAGMIDSLGVKA
jgi:hypothetical protein